MQLQYFSLCHSRSTTAQDIQYASNDRRWKWLNYKGWQTAVMRMSDITSVVFWQKNNSPLPQRENIKLWFILVDIRATVAQVHFTWPACATLPVTVSTLHFHLLPPNTQLKSEKFSQVVSYTKDYAKWNIQI